MMRTLNKEKYIRRNYKLIIILAVVIAVWSMFITGCSNKVIQEQSDTEREYVVNERTKRIHSVDCQYVSKISDKNKRIVEDAITNLLKKEYVICRKCRAGMKAAPADEFKNRLFYYNLNVADIEVDASREEYLSAIDTMGEWYINHVPTYAARIEEEAFEKYKGNLVNYKEYQLKSKNGKIRSYNVITSDSDSNSVNQLKASTQILRAKESAAQNYINAYTLIDFQKRIAYYPCDEISPKAEYNMPGDDCVRYIFSIFSKMDEEFETKYEKLTRKKYSNTSSLMLTDDSKNIAFGLNNLGFRIFDAEEGKIDVGDDGVIEGYIFKIDDGFTLQKGDILARDGHVHVYLGDGIVTDAPNFGWGRVYRDYPQKYDICITKREDERNYVSLINSAGKEEVYSRVYRYIGNNERE